ncbi:MAG: hypothetical protein ACJATE_000936 [Bacteroidia bacterium]
MNLAHKLENDLIHRIGQRDNVNFLKAIQSILDSSDKEFFQLNELHTRKYLVTLRNGSKTGNLVATDKR